MKIKMPRFKKNGEIQRTITVAELVAELKKFPSKTPVVSNGWITTLEVERCRVQTGGGFNHKAIRINYEL